jgi:hypothetical protein
LHGRQILIGEGSNETSYTVPSYASCGSLAADLDAHGAIFRLPETVDRYAEQPGRRTTAGDSIRRDNPRKGVGSKQLRVRHLRVDIDAREDAPQGAGLGHAAERAPGDAGGGGFADQKWLSGLKSKEHPFRVMLSLMSDVTVVHS